MFESNKLTIEKVKDLLYAVYNEFNNELDYDYESIYKEELNVTDFYIMLEFLEKYINKVELCLNDEFNNRKGSDLVWLKMY